MADIPVKLPLRRIYIGDTYEFLLKDFKDGDANPIDLSGYAIKMSIRQRNETGPVVHTVEIGSGFVVEDSVQNSGQKDALRCTISNTDTSKFKPGQHIFDIQFTKDNVVQTWFKDYIDVEQEVTQ